jgi:hypothetical protein
MAKRTDVHSPSNIIPSDYEFILVCTREEELCGSDIKYFQSHMQANGAIFSQHDHKGGCDVCGANMIDYAIFYHNPSNKYIKTGLDCASKIEAGHEDAFRRVAQLRRAKKERLVIADKIASALPEAALDFLESVTEGNISGSYSVEALGDLIEGLDNRELDVVSNALYLISYIIHTCIKRRVVPTVKQINLISIKINFIKEFREKMFVKKANRVPALEGKVTVEGSVVAIKRQEDMYGITYKMLVNDKRGFDVWSTVPSSILGSV